MFTKEAEDVDDEDLQATGTPADYIEQRVRREHSLWTKVRYYHLLKSGMQFLLLFPDFRIIYQSSINLIYTFLSFKTLFYHLTVFPCQLEAFSMQK